MKLFFFLMSIYLLICIYGEGKIYITNDNETGPAKLLLFAINKYSTHTRTSKYCFDCLDLPAFIHFHYFLCFGTKILLSMLKNFGYYAKNNVRMYQSSSINLSSEIDFLSETLSNHLFSVLAVKGSLLRDKPFFVI